MGTGTASRRWRCWLAHAAHGFEIELELIDAALNAAAIGFELGFAGSAGADAAAQLRHGFAAAGEARQHVFELRQLHLQLALAGAGVAGEDVEDQLRAIEHAAGQSGFKVAQLRGREVVIEEDEIGVGGSRDAGDLLHFAGADERGGIGARAALEQLGSNLAAGAQEQLAKLGERFLGVETGNLARRADHDPCERIVSEDADSFRRGLARKSGVEAHARRLVALFMPARLPRERTPKVHSHKDGALRPAAPAANIRR